ncbi:MAG: AAA family ATPase [Dissulfurispiraceae bacterium]
MFKETEIYEAISTFHEQSRISDAGWFLIIGPPASGKTTAARHYEQQHTRTNEDGKVDISVIYTIISPMVTPKSLATDLLYRLGDRLVNKKERVCSLTAQLCQRLRIHGVELIILDEFQHLACAHSAAVSGKLVDWLTNLQSETGISFVFLGLEAVTIPGMDELPAAFKRKLIYKRVGYPHPLETMERLSYSLDSSKFNQQTLNAIFNRLGTPIAGRRLVENARLEAAVRDIHSGKPSMRYSSHKMKRPISIESRTAELPALIQYENDPLVLEYYSQPCKLDLILKAAGEPPYRIKHVPDFLIIRADQILIEEWREEGRLVTLAAKHPTRYFKGPDGWHFPAAEKQLAGMGITYRLRSVSEYPLRYVRNLMFLSDYLSTACLPVEQKKIDIFHLILAEQGELTLAELMASAECYSSNLVGATGEAIADAERLITYDDIYKAIVDGHIAFDLLNDDVAETHSAHVYCDQTMLTFYQRTQPSEEAKDIDYLDVSFAMGTEFDYDGKTFRIAFVGQNNMLLSTDDGTTELPLEVLEKQYAAGKINIQSSAHHNNARDATPAVLSPKKMGQALESARQLEYAEIAPEPVVISKPTQQCKRKLYGERAKALLINMLNSLRRQYKVETMLPSTKGKLRRN